MSEPQSTLPVPPEPPSPPRRRWRRFLVLAACIGFVLIAAPVAFYLWANSDETQNLARQRLVAMLEQTTGGRVQIAAFRCGSDTFCAYLGLKWALVNDI